MFIIKAYKLSQILTGLQNESQSTFNFCLHLKIKMKT